MVDTMEVTLDTVLDMDMDLCGVARRGRLKLPPLLLLILTPRLILTLKLTHGFCIEVLEATMVDTMEVTLDTVLDMDMDLCGVARRGRPNLPLLLTLMLIPGCIMDMVVTMALVTTMEDGEDTDGEDMDSGVVDYH